MNREVVLRTEQLTKRFGGLTAVDAASVEFFDGINGLIGPNGSGKTTFFNCVTGMIKPDGGRVEFDGRPITGMPPHRIAQAGMGRSFQLCRILPRMSVLENMLVGAKAPHGWEMLRGARRGHQVDQARELLVRVGIDHLENTLAADLSYGQQKLLELAGVLMSRPRLIMLDEPAGGVNPALIERIANLVRELRAEGATFVIVEHNMDLVMSLCEHVVVFDRGRPIAAGDPASVQGDPRVLEAYLGI